MTDHLLRVAPYIRVSTEEQAKFGFSMDEQDRVLREHAVRQKWEVVEVVADPGDSGADPERPGLLRILELAEAGKIDLVLTWKRDRLFRDVYHRPTIKRIAENDVYLARPCEEVAALVSPEVAERLDSSARYGVYWFGRVHMDRAYGRGSRKFTVEHNPREEWIAIPVPDFGIPPEWVFRSPKARGQRALVPEHTPRRPATGENPLCVRVCNDQSPKRRTPILRLRPTPQA